MRKKCWGAASLIVAAAVLSGCSSSDDGFGGDDSSFQPIEQSDVVSGYTYKLTGSADSVDVTMNTDGGSTQETGAALPFEQEVGALDFLYISAQITDESGGDVSCEIVDSTGDVVATNTASGFPSIVTCDNT